MWSSVWKYWLAFECLLKLLKDLQGPETGQNQSWATCSKAEVLSVWCGGARPQCRVSQCFLGCQPEMHGETECETGDVESFRPCEQHRLPAPSPACSPATSGQWQASTAVLVLCSMPWHCWKGGRKGAAGSNLCCLQSKLFGLQCAARVFLGLVLQAGLVAWKFSILNSQHNSGFCLKSCFPAELPLQRAQRPGTLWCS